MPELPEVETVVKTLAPVLLGRRIVRILHLRPDIVSPASCDLSRCLTRRTVVALHRRAKRIVFTLDDANAFYIHLGMTGRLTVEPPDAEVLPHTHLILQLDNVRQLRFRDPRRFGGLFWVGPSVDDPALGPEPLTLSSDDLAARLRKTTRAIKNALLDQRLIAGLGNIYVDESLFRAKLHPLKRADRLTRDEVRALSHSIKRVLTKAIRHRGSTLRDYVDANGQPGAFQKLHDVYDRTGAPCRNCKHPITRIVVGGRSTHFCAQCQPRRKRGGKSE